MAEVNTAEVEAKAEAAFGAGFDDTPPAPAAKVVETPVAEPAKPAAVAPAPVPEKPQYVRLTKQEWDNAKASVLKVSSLESQLAKLTGSIPKAEQIVQQAIAAIQAQTPAGQAVEVTDDDVAEIVADFPDLGGSVKKALQKVAGKLRGTGAAQSPTQPVDIGAEVEKVLTGREKQALEENHPTWRDIVGAVNVSAGDQIPETNPFRQWLATQSADYQKKINDTNSPAVVQNAIERFLAAKPAQAPPSPKPPDRGAARRAVIEDAITPRADGNPPPLNSPQSAEEAFATGFKVGKPH